MQQHFTGEAVESPMEISNIYSVEQPDDFRTAKRPEFSYVYASQAGICLPRPGTSDCNCSIKYSQTVVGGALLEGAVTD